MSLRKKKPKVDPFDQFAEKANPKATQKHDSVRRAGILRSYIWACAVAMPFVVIGGLLSMFSLNINYTEMFEQMRADQNNSDSSLPRAVALDSVERWLAAEPSPLPGGHVLSWESVRVNLPPTDSNDPAVQIHNVILAGPSGGLYSSSVPVQMSAAGPVVISSPSLQPLPPTPPPSTSESPWPGTSTISVPVDVTSAVRAWATALASADPEALRLAVGDPDGANSYMPLPKAEVVSAEVSVATAANGAKVNSETGGPDTVVARVTLRLAWESQKDEENPESAQQGAPISFDVLVQGADTASPRVVSWGAPGDGMSLSPYSTALTNVRLTAQEVQTRG